MTYSRETLTGRSRHRADEAGRLILQVEVDRHSNAPTLRHWRDAKAEDLTVKNSIPEAI
jgi:hypothetical protein